MQRKKNILLLEKLFFFFYNVIHIIFMTEKQLNPKL